MNHQRHSAFQGIGILPIFSKLASKRGILLGALAILLTSGAAWGADKEDDAAAVAGRIAPARPACETLVPSTTKAFVSVPDPALLRKQWDKTQLGQLSQNPDFKPFSEDVQKQLQERLSEMDARLGVTWADLDGVAGGEICLAVMQPGGDSKRHAVATLVDVTGNNAQAERLLAKIRAEMAQRKAQRDQLQHLGVTIEHYVIPPSKGQTRAEQAYHCITNDWLLAADELSELQAMIGRIQGKLAGATLGQTPAFVEIQQRVRKQENSTPHIRWHVEPFGYGQVMRAASQRKKKGRDVVGILAEQGFDAIEGIGGAVSFAVNGHEVVHRTLLLAPDSDGQRPRLTKAAQMLNLPNEADIDPPEWTPQDVGGWLRLSWRMKAAFSHIGSLVDALEGEPGLWEDVLESLKEDPTGPRVDIRKDLVAHLAKRAYMITRPRLPITPNSEQRMYIFELANVPALEKELVAAMQRDPTVIPVQVAGVKQTIWKIQPRQRRQAAPGNPFAKPPRNEREQRRALSSGAVAIAHGCLLYASDVEFMASVLKNDGPALTMSADYQRVDNALRKLGAGLDSIRYFSRTDMSQQVDYELLRQGKMPQSKTLLGQLLNELFKPEEKGVLREQQIDGSKLPPFEKAAPYMGPSGLFVRSLPDGWMVTGCLLDKQPQAGQQAEAAEEGEGPAVARR